MLASLLEPEELLETSRFQPKEYLRGKKGCRKLLDVHDENLCHVWNFVWAGEHMHDYPRLLGDLQYSKYPCESERIRSIMEMIWGVIRMQLSDPNRPKTCPVNTYFLPIPRRDDPQRIGAVFFRVAFNYSPLAMAQQPSAIAAAAEAARREEERKENALGIDNEDDADGDNAPMQQVINQAGMLDIDADAPNAAGIVNVNNEPQNELNIAIAMLQRNMLLRQLEPRDNDMASIATTESNQASPIRNADGNGDAPNAIGVVDNDDQGVVRRRPRRPREEPSIILPVRPAMANNRAASEEASEAQDDDEGGNRRNKKAKKDDHETLSWDQLKKYFEYLSKLNSKRTDNAKTQHHEKFTIDKYIEAIYCHYYVMQGSPHTDISANGVITSRTDMFNPLNAFSLDNALALLQRLVDGGVVDAKYADGDSYTIDAEGRRYHYWPDEGRDVYRCVDRQCTKVKDYSHFQMPWVTPFEIENKQTTEMRQLHAGERASTSLEYQMLHTKIPCVKGREVVVFMGMVEVATKLIGNTNTRLACQVECIGKFHQFLWNTNGMLPPSVRYIVLYEQLHMRIGIHRDHTEPRFVFPTPDRKFNVSVSQDAQRASPKPRTIFGDYLQRRVNQLDSVHDIRVLHIEILLSQFASWQLHFYTPASIHIAYVGNAAVGKSKILDMLMRLTIPESWMRLTTVTPSAFYSQSSVISDQHDCIVEVYHEAPPTMFGLGTSTRGGRGKQNDNTDVLSALKDRMESSKISKLIYSKDPVTDVGTPMKQVAFLHTSVQMASNAPLSAFAGALADRFALISISRRIRLDKVDRDIGGQIDAAMELAMKRFVFRDRCMQVLFAKAATLIRTKIIVDISDDVGITLINEIMHAADQLDLRETKNSRHRNRWMMLAKTMCLTDALLRVFRASRERDSIDRVLEYRQANNGELPPDYKTDPKWTEHLRVDPHREPDFGLNNIDFIKLEPWLYLRQEHMVAAAAMLDFQWERQTDILVMQAIQDLYAPITDMEELQRLRSKQGNKKTKHRSQRYQSPLEFEQQQLKILKKYQERYPEKDINVWFGRDKNVTDTVKYTNVAIETHENSLIADQKRQSDASSPRLQIWLITDWIIKHIPTDPMHSDVMDSVKQFTGRKKWILEPDNGFIFISRDLFDSDFKTSRLRECIEKKLSHVHAREQTMVYARTHLNHPDQLQSIHIKRLPAFDQHGNATPLWAPRNHKYLHPSSAEFIKDDYGMSNDDMDRLYNVHEKHTALTCDIDEMGEREHRKRLFFLDHGRNPTNDEVASWICKTDEFYQQEIMGINIMDAQEPQAQEQKEQQMDWDIPQEDENMDDLLNGMDG